MTNEQSRDILDEKDDPYFHRRQETVQVFTTAGATFCGFYQGLNKNRDIVLQPVLTIQGKFVPGTDKRIDMGMWNDAPAYINNHMVSAVLPISRKYLDDRIREDTEAFQRHWGSSSDYSI